MSRTKRVRSIVKTLAGLGLVAAVLVGVGLFAHWPTHTSPTPTAIDPVTPGDRVERLTQRDLAALETEVARTLAVEARTPGRWPVDLRAAAIGLSMAGPLAPLSQAGLAVLGDHAGMRRAGFFVMPLVRWMSEPFLFVLDPVSGESGTMDFTPVIGLIASRAAVGRTLTLDHVGDAALSASDAAAYRDTYVALFRRYGAGRPQAPLHVSLKLSALVHDLPAAVDDTDAAAAEAKRAEIRSVLRELLAAGAASVPAGVFVRMDMEEYRYKDLTLATFRALVEESPDLTRNPSGELRLGVVLQAYLRDTARDVAALAAWAQAEGVRVPVRLVKGAYEAFEKDLAATHGRASPVWDFKESTDANYEALAEVLLRRSDNFAPAFATHNLRTQARVMALGEMLGRPRSDLEIQMLYGMGDPIKTSVVELGCRLREYVPFGPLHRGLKYAARRFDELANPSNALARSLHGDFAILAEPPAFHGAADIADGAFTMTLLKASAQPGF